MSHRTAVSRRLAGLLFAGLIGLVGCAGRTGVTREVSDQRDLVSAGHSAGRFDIEVYHQEEAYVARLQASSDSVFLALLDVYPGLGIPILTLDMRRRLVGNTDFGLRRRLAGQRLAIYFDCGRDMTGEYANQWELTLDVVSSAEPEVQAEDSGRPAGPGTLLRTRARAQATPNDHGLRSVRCTSTGALELHIARLVAAQLEQL